MKVRTRFAPSPTGSLHVGGVRTALFNWLFARKNHGTFILRIEDTDVERSTEASAQGIIESLKWLGLNWDEGPYFQSARAEIYRTYLDLLHEKGFIYPAFETKEELETMRAKALAEKRNPIYDRASLKFSIDEIQHKMNSGETFVWRFKVPDEGYTEVPERLMADADYRLKNDTIGDFVITRPGTKNHPGVPLYNFVCAIDDALMEITHVIRGVEHLPNTAKQLLILQALGYSSPEYIHLPLIMKHGKKMSKRDLDADGRFPVSVLERRDLGYLPDATLNHLALLGWSPADGEEVFNLEKLIASFGLDRLSKSNANFDEDKYFFLNAEYIKQKSAEDLLILLRPFFEKADLHLSQFDHEKMLALIELEKPRAKTLADFPEALTYFFARPTHYDEVGMKKFFQNENSNAPQILQATIDALTALATFDLASIDECLHQVREKLGLSFSKFGPVLRLALTGRTQSPSVSEIMVLMGKEEVIERLAKLPLALAYFAAKV